MKPKDKIKLAAERLAKANKESYGAVQDVIQSMGFKEGSFDLRELLDWKECPDWYYAQDPKEVEEGIRKETELLRIDEEIAQLTERRKELVTET